MKLIVGNKVEHGALILVTRPDQLVISCYLWVISVKGSLMIDDFFNNDLPLEGFFVEAICVMVIIIIITSIKKHPIKLHI